LTGFEILCVAQTVVGLEATCLAATNRKEGPTISRAVTPDLVISAQLNVRGNINSGDRKQQIFFDLDFNVLSL
jgi:hypothetical protein